MTLVLADAAWQSMNDNRMTAAVGVTGSQDDSGSMNDRPAGVEAGWKGKSLRLIVARVLEIHCHYSQTIFVGDSGKGRNQGALLVGRH